MEAVGADVEADIEALCERAPGDAEALRAVGALLWEGTAHSCGSGVALSPPAGPVDGHTKVVVKGQGFRHFGTMMKWADEMRKLDVRTNADTPHDSEVARKFGAQGIGLCRTEHMFFEADRIRWVREMILADDEAGRRRALGKLLPIQRGDFEGIATRNGVSYGELVLQDRRRSVFHWEFLDPERLVAGRAAVLDAGSPPGGREVYAFWVNQDVVVPRAAFLGAVRGAAASPLNRRLLAG